MINSIISAVGISLNNEFGDGYKIYPEAVEQGLEEPCFFIQCAGSSIKRELDDRFYRQNLFCVQFFPSDKLNPAGECRSAAERLLLCLEYINVDGSLMCGTKMNYEIADGILNFFVNYNSFVKKEKKADKPVMEKLSRKITGRAGN